MIHDFELNNSHRLFAFFTAQGTALLRLTPGTDALEQVLQFLPHTTNPGQSRLVSTPHSHNTCGPLTLPIEKKNLQVVVKCVCPKFVLEVAEGPSFQLGGSAWPITEKWEGVTGLSKHDNMALAYIPRSNCQLLFIRALNLDERCVCAVDALSNT